MNKNLIIFVVVLVGLFGFLLLWGGSSTATLPVSTQIERGTELSLNQSEYEFGTIGMYDGNVMTSFVVSNLTDRDIKIDSIVTSCMCTTAYLVMGSDKKGPYGMPGHGSVVPRVNEIIKAGEDMLIEVVFDPAAHGPQGAGHADRSVYVIDENGGALEFVFTADVILQN